MTTATETRLVSVTEAAERLGCSRGHVYDLIAAGHFKTVDIGAATKAKTRLRDSDVEDFIALRTRHAP